MKARKIPVDYCDVCERETGTDVYTGECGGCEMTEILKHRNGDYADRTGSDEPLGLMSGVFVLIAMVIVSIIIADVATGFNLHNLLAGVMTSGV
jgi:hypothetical protein